MQKTNPRLMACFIALAMTLLSPSVSAQLTEQQGLVSANVDKRSKNDTTSNKAVMTQAKDDSSVTVFEPNVTFEVNGIVKNIDIRNNSKKAGGKLLYTYLTVVVETTQPTDLASRIPKTLSFISRTDTHEARDRALSAGDKVTVTVIGNNFTDPEWFRLRDLKKLNH